MKKILIVSYYHLKESLLCASESFINLGYDICNFPLFQYAYDKNDKRLDYLELFLETIEKEEPNIILWWFFGISANDIQYIYNKNANLYHILYNWDDPFCWNSSEFPKKCKNFDLVISSCFETQSNYLKSNVKKVIYSLPPYSPSIYFPIDDIKYECDISFCITNLYESEGTYPNQFINRKYIIDTLYNSDLIFHLYGPNYLRDLYPKSYKGYVKHDNLSDIFHKSRINLSTHIVSGKSGYLNERSILILASGGLLLVEPNDILKNNENCVFLEEDFIEQIKGILNNYDDYEEIKQNGIEFVKEMHWDNWAMQIHVEIAKHFFNTTVYNKLYLPEEQNGEVMWEHWLMNRDNMYDEIKIPPEFNFTKYKTDFNLNISDVMLYWHWKKYGKRDKTYLRSFTMKSKISNRDVGENINLIPSEQLKLFNTFSKLSDKNETANALGEMKQILLTSPYIDLGVCLDKYIGFIENE